MSKSIAFRIEWCRLQSTQARAPREREGWHAEGEGLRDALFNRDHTTQYQQGPPVVFERYAMGLQYGHALLRSAEVYLQFATPSRTAGPWRNAGIYCMGDVSTRRMLGLTRRSEP
ncbi:MAG TPA: hypothetical protein VES92_10610 [Nitrospiraceae bacterium]|nr:hypothetical protein [Nitrospiraceae bacterium]